MGKNSWNWPLELSRGFLKFSALSVTARLSRFIERFSRFIERFSRFSVKFNKKPKNYLNLGKSITNSSELQIKWNKFCWFICNMIYMIKVFILIKKFKSFCEKMYLLNKVKCIVYSLLIKNYETNFFSLLTWSYVF